MNVTILSGLSPKDSPFPLPELALGNVVRLKKPYPSPALKGERRYRWGVIAEHVSYNAWGIPKVALHLYDGRGRMLMGPRHVPEYVDTVASYFRIWHLAGAMYHAVLLDGKGFDLYPTCPACHNRNQHPFNEKKCSTCAGWGHVRTMRRLSDSAS